MAIRTPGRPDVSEFAPYAKIYVDLVEGDDIGRALADQSASTMARLRPVGDAAAGTYVYAPGKWTIKQIIGHVIDTERVFGYRALCVARGDTASLPRFEQDDYVRQGGANDRPLADLLDEFGAVRRATIALFAGLPPDAWLRRGTANGFSVTTRGLAFLVAGHELHHRRVLEEKYLGRV